MCAFHFKDLLKDTRTLDAQDQMGLAALKEDTKDFDDFLRTFFSFLLVYGMIGFGNLNLMGSTFEQALRGFSMSLSNALTVIMPLAFVLVFPVPLAYVTAKFVHAEKYRGDMILMAIAYSAIVLNSTIQTWFHLPELFAGGPWQLLVGIVIFFYVLSHLAYAMMNPANKLAPIAGGPSTIVRIAKNIFAWALIFRLLATLLTAVATSLHV
jgi:hypothetical protein